MEKKMLSVVMPAYNEGAHIYENIKIVDRAVSAFADQYEIIAVNDGSTDNTKTEILRAKKEYPHVRLVSYTKNKGKGKAIKEGVLASEGEYIAFLDADLDLPPEQLSQYWEKLVSDQADVVIGSKMHKDSKIEYPFVRKIMSFCYYCMLRILFHLKVHDTQTGIKMFKAKALKPVIQLIKTEGFAYDIEILVALNYRKYRIMEMPVELIFTRENGMGRIKFSDIIKVFKDTIAIFYRLNIKKYYQ